MPIRATDPFADPTAGLDPAVNPFLARLVNGLHAGDLPLVFGPTLRSYPGAWRARFAAQMGMAPRALVLEIGCHHGETLMAMAQAFPDIGFIGLDITFKRVVKTAAKAKSLGLKNVISVLANAKGLAPLFQPEELDGVAIFYPDPWNKKVRQIKHQLVQNEFCAVLADKLAPNGFIWAKTDQYSYFTQMLAAFAANALKPAPSGNLPPLLGSDFGTCFERNFQAAGMSTFATVWVKTPIKS